MKRPRHTRSTLTFALSALLLAGCCSEPAPAEPPPAEVAAETVVLSGTVTFADGRAPDDVSVTAYDADHRPLKPPATTTTDSTGLWQLAVPAWLLDAPQGFLSFTKGGFEPQEYRAGNLPEKVEIERRR